MLPLESKTDFAHCGGLLGFDHVDAHLAELRQDVLNLFGLDLFHGQQPKGDIGRPLMRRLR